MASTFEGALSRFLAECAFVANVHDLATKWRIEFEGGYFLDVFFNAALGKYSYTLSKGETRILGWDNAPHHPKLANSPHHFHRADGSVTASDLTGDPEHDLEIVRIEIERFLEPDMSAKA